MIIFAQFSPEYKNRQSGPEPLGRIIQRLLVQIGWRAVDYNSRQGNFADAAGIRQTLAGLGATASCGAL